MRGWPNRTLSAATPACEQRQLRVRAMRDHSLTGTVLVGGHRAMVPDPPGPPAPQPGERWPERGCLLSLAPPRAPPPRWLHRLPMRSSEPLRR